MAKAKRAEPEDENTDERPESEGSTDGAPAEDVTVDETLADEPLDDAPEDIEGAEDDLDDDDFEDDEGRRSRFRRLAKRLMDRRELGNDTKVLLGSALAASDKAKTEAVKLIAREVRSYLDALELKQDLKELANSYSLEISISLKPLAGQTAEADVPDDAPTPDGGDPAV